MSSQISISVNIKAPLETVWQLWTESQHIREWNNVDESWHTPHVVLEFRPGGEFFYRMETKDGREGFDYKGTLDNISYLQRIEYALTDGRRTVNTFNAVGDTTQLTETFDTEKETPVDLQENFCFRILQSFKNYAESTWDLNNVSVSVMIIDLGE